MDLAQTATPHPGPIRGSDAVLRVLRSKGVHHVFENRGTDELRAARRSGGPHLLQLPVALDR
jgi:hypothetical protein